MTILVDILLLQEKVPKADEVRTNDGLRLK